MNTTRRSTLIKSPLYAFPIMAAVGAGFVASCAPTAPANTSVEQFIANTQTALAYAAPIAAMISIFVPGAAVYVPLVEQGISAALSVFNTVSSAMTQAQAQPLAGKIGTYLDAAVAAAQNAVNVIPDPTQRAKANAVLAQVTAGTALAFATGAVVVAAMPTAALAPIKVPSLPVRIVR